MKELTHIKKLKDPKYIGSYELMISDTEVKEMTVTIEKVVQEYVQNGDKKELKPVMHIVGQKPMIVSATVNIKNLIKATGTPFIENMAGKQITLFLTKEKFFGELQYALRIRPFAPKTKVLNVENEIVKMNNCKSLQELQTVYLSFSKDLQLELVTLKNELKIKLSNEDK